MPQFIGFSVQISFVFRILADMERNTFDNIDACIFQRLNFFRIVGQQLDSTDIQMVVDLLGKRKSRVRQRAVRARGWLRPYPSPRLEAYRHGFC